MEKKQTIKRDFYKESENKIIIYTNKEGTPTFVIVFGIFICFAFLLSIFNTLTDTIFAVVAAAILPYLIYLFIKRKQRIIINKKSKQVYKRTLMICKYICDINDFWYIHTNKHKYYIYLKEQRSKSRVFILESKENAFGTNLLLERLYELLPELSVAEMRFIQQENELNNLLTLFKEREQDIYTYKFINQHNHIALSIAFILFVCLIFINPIITAVGLITLLILPKKSKIEVNTQEQSISITINKLYKTKIQSVLYKDMQGHKLANYHTFSYPPIIPHITENNEFPIKKTFTEEQKKNFIRDLELLTYKGKNLRLFVVVGFVIQNSHCSIDLLYKNETNHLV